MYYRIKILNNNSNNKRKNASEYYLTDASHFAEAAQNVIKEIGINNEIEDICLMKNYKPAINECYSDHNKLYLVKLAEDIILDSGKIKTVKYVLPAFANNSDELHKIVNDYIAQGMENMRLTTISETNWIYI